MLDVLMEASRMRSAAEERKILSEDLEARILDLGPCKSLISRLEASPGILAEIKRSSPSAKTFRRELDAAHQAGLYQTGGAAGISV